MPDLASVYGFSLTMGDVYTLSGTKNFSDKERKDFVEFISNHHLIKKRCMRHTNFDKTYIEFWNHKCETYPDLCVKAATGYDIGVWDLVPLKKRRLLLTLRLVLKRYQQSTGIEIIFQPSIKTKKGKSSNS